MNHQLRRFITRAGHNVPIQPIYKIVKCISVVGVVLILMTSILHNDKRTSQERTTRSIDKRTIHVTTARPIDVTTTLSVEQRAIDTRTTRPIKRRTIHRRTTYIRPIHERTNHNNSRKYTDGIVHNLQNAPLGLTRNGTNLEYKEKFWYHLNYMEDGVLSNIYLHRFYLDDRLKTTVNARTFINVDRETKIKAKCLLHFENITINASTSIADVTVIAFVADKKNYHTYMVSCPFKGELYWNMRSSLKYVSFLFLPNNTESEKVPVVIPEKRTDGVNDSIGLCLMSQYGFITDKLYTPYIIQWVEMLKIFGVSKITWYNSSLASDDIYFDKVINYYASTGIIKFVQVPIPFKFNKNDSFHWTHMPTAEAQANEILKSSIVNDCFYRDLHQHWYVLHTDKDELVVPYNKKQTYQSFLKSFIGNQPKEYRDNIINIPSLITKSGFFYLTSKKVRPNVPDHFPLLKYTYRQPTEPVFKSPGYSKAFVNPRSCNHVWSHRCMLGNDNNFGGLPEKDIQIHHYRYKCYTHIERDIRTGLGQGCDTEEERQFEDNIIGEQHGDILKERTLDVLRKIDYFK